jgi:hypothetical protein
VDMDERHTDGKRPARKKTIRTKGWEGDSSIPLNFRALVWTLLECSFCLRDPDGLSKSLVKGALTIGSFYGY